MISAAKACFWGSLGYKSRYLFGGKIVFSLIRHLYLAETRKRRKERKKALLFEEIDTFNVLVFFWAPLFWYVAHADFLALIHVQCSCEGCLHKAE
jgi:hypothetical protein